MNGKVGKRAIIPIVIFALLIGTVGVLIWKLGSAPDNSEPFVLLSAGFTDRKIADQTSALAAIGDVADMLGVEDVNTEFAQCKIDTVFGNTYYRFRQMYQGIPVYGRCVIVTADSSGDSMALSSNYVAVRDINATASVAQQEVAFAIQEFLSEQFGASEFDDIFVEEISDDALCVYNEGDLNLLAYHLRVAHPKIGCYEMIVNAQEPEVLYANSLIQYDYKYEADGHMETISADGQRTRRTFDVYNQGGVYYMADVNRYIELYQLENSKSYYWSWANWEVANKIVYTGNEFVVSWNNSNQPTEYAAEVDALANIQVAYDYYAQELVHKSTDGQGKSTIYLYTNAAILDEERDVDWTDNAASGSDIQSNTTEIYVGRAKNNQYALSVDLDVMAHEYTHAVIQFICGLDGTDETDAINEGCSDVFGELIEKWKTGSCDWIHGRRTIYAPSVNGYAETVSDTNNGGEDFAHGHSTVISHAAYLMYTGIDRNPNFESLNTDELAELFYRTFYTLPPDCTFSQFRSLMQNTANNMWKEGRLTYEQTRCVSNAFFQVGITPATTPVVKTLTMNVYGIDCMPYDNYTLYVRCGDDENIYDGKDVSTEGITFPKLGQYELCVVDNANNDNKTSVIVKVVEHGGATEMPVFTQCGVVKAQEEIHSSIVTDAYSKDCTYTTKIYNEQTGGSEETQITASYRIPEIHLTGDTVEKINTELYDTLYPVIQNSVSEIAEYGYPWSSEEISYDWVVNGDILSLVVENRKLPDYGAGTDYYVYNISISDGTVLSTESVVAAAGFSMEEYYKQAEQVLGSHYWSGWELSNGNFENSDFVSWFNDALQKTISQDNVNQSFPYMNEQGQLCIVAKIYSLADAEYYWNNLNMIDFELNPNYNKSAQLIVKEVSHTYDEAEALLYEYFGNKYGYDCVTVRQVTPAGTQGVQIEMNITGEGGAPIYFAEWYKVNLETGEVRNADNHNYLCDLW